VKQGPDPELVNVKLLVLSDARGIIGADLWSCVNLITVKVTTRGHAGGLQCDVSGLHPQQDWSGSRRVWLCVRASSLHEIWVRHHGRIVRAQAFTST
jgi:hypothetical protein